MSINPQPRTCELSVVIPVWNGEKDVRDHIRKLAPILDRLTNGSWEVIVVDDGSTDNTITAAQAAIQNSDKIIILPLTPNRGKGYSVQRGVKETCGRNVLVCDVDMATPPETIVPFLNELRTGTDIVIGNRKSPSSNIKRPQSLARVVLSRCYIHLARICTGVKLSDFNCGFKLFKGDVAREILNGSLSNRWAIDVESLAVARQRGYRISEIPVIWNDSGKSTVRLPLDLLRTLVELARIAVGIRMRRQTKD